MKIFKEKDQSNLKQYDDQDKEKRSKSKLHNRMSPLNIGFPSDTIDSSFTQQSQNRVLDHLTKAAKEIKDIETESMVADFIKNFKNGDDYQRRRTPKHLQSINPKV